MRDQAMRLWLWLAGAVVAVVAACAYWYARIRHDQAVAAHARADVTEKLARRAVERSTKRLTHLQADADRNAARIVQVRADLAQRKERLHATFEKQGLSAAEIQARLQKIRL